MTDDVAEIARLEDERYKAVIGKDLDALERLLYDDLVYYIRTALGTPRRAI